MLKIRLIFYTCLCLVLFSACARNDFKVVEPPINNFPKANEYTEVEVTKGKFVSTKSFSGIIENKRLIIDITPQVIESFKSGEKGTITFMEKGKSYEIDAISAEGIMNNIFIVDPIDASAYMPNKIPAKFSVATYQKDDAIIVPKNAVVVLDENNAIVLKLSENGILKEIKITIGEANETHYEIIDGIEAGEKVVVRK